MSTVSGWPEALPRPIHRCLPRRAAQDPWFEVYEIGTGAYSIVEPYHYEETVSFVVEGDDLAVLLDTGMGVGDIRAEAERLTSRPLVVINTHWHYDHIGGNYQFKDVWAYDDDFEVSKIERGVPLTEASAAQYMKPESICRPLPPSFDPATYWIRPCRVTRRLRHHEQIELGGRALVVHHTPGHSPGGICLFDTKDRILFTGDCYYPGTIYGHLERGDPGQFLQTMEYLSTLVPAVSVVAPSHNESLVPAAELLHATAGFRQIAAGTAQYTVKDGIRLYTFERFRIELLDGSVSNVRTG